MAESQNLPPLAEQIIQDALQREKKAMELNQPVKEVDSEALIQAVEKEISDKGQGKLSVEDRAKVLKRITQHLNTQGRAEAVMTQGIEPAQYDN